MYFHKIDHPYNFQAIKPSQEPYRTTVTSYGKDCWRVRVSRPGWIDMAGRIGLIDEACRCDNPPASRFELTFDDSGLQVVDRVDRQVLLASHPAVPFGVCGSRWLFSFKLDGHMRMYGMGEKNIGFEKSGRRTKFWNSDVWADFAWSDIEHGTTDPMYASFAVLLIKQAESWLGLMLPTPVASFMDTGARHLIEGAKTDRTEKRFFYLGAADGCADLVVAAGHSAAEVVRVLTRMLGRAPLMPLWAMGHHQSRWGYGTMSDASQLDESFVQHDIPCDAIWFDIDYMEGYRVFTSREAKPDTLDLHGRKLVAILDPGVKVDQYRICTEGLKRDLFCHNPQGLPYVGFVWPGASHFPDFSLEEARSWWARETARLASTGFDAFWIDMNDPSTGSMEVEQMRFDRGGLDHQMLHNWYGSGMAIATSDGLRQAYPDRRPFVLTRSAMLGSHRHAALWTGDSMSNYHHLRKSVEMALSLSLSTMAFTGSDIGGFGGNCDAELLVDWYRACALFPLLRNHSADGTHRQEPWQFGDVAQRAVRSTIRMRYALLPYLYQLMVQSHEQGQAIVRPMLYDDNDERFEHEATQFMIGEALLQAPKLERDQHHRQVLFPKGTWLDLSSLTPNNGPVELTVDLIASPLPLFLKEGCFVPLSCVSETGLHSTAAIDLSKPLFVFFPGAIAHAQYRYVYDTGDGYAPMESVQLTFVRLENELNFTIDTNSFHIAVALPHEMPVTVNGTRVSGKPWFLPFADALGTATQDTACSALSFWLFESFR